MVSLAYVIAAIVMPISALILGILIFPLTPNFLLKRFSRYLWDLSLSINRYRFKLVHLMLFISFILCFGKGKEYYELIYSNEIHSEAALALDLKMKMNRCGRDFYIMGNLLAMWLYIFRIIPLISNLVN